MRFLLLVFSVFLGLLLLEGLTRGHHYLRYRIKNPIHSSLVFYDADVLEMTRKGGEPISHPPPEAPGKTLVFSGGSVAWGFGAPQSSRIGLHLQKEMEVPVLDLSFPGKDLKLEIKDLLTLKPEAIEDIVFLSGFNDIYQVGLVATMQRRKMRWITRVPFLNDSLLFHKIFRRISLFSLRKNYSLQREISQIRKDLELLHKKFPNNRIHFFFQPILSAKKLLAGRETEINKFYNSRLNEALGSRRKALVQVLKSLSWLNFIDLQEPFDQAKEEVFLDICHLNEKGASLLGKLMVQELSGGKGLKEGAKK